MKWDYKLPKFGDVIRVKAGVLYHYGLFVNEDQVVQFGLNPLARQNVKDAQVEVLVTDVEGFLLGGELERGVVQFKDGLRFSRKKSVKIASATLSALPFTSILVSQTAQYRWYLSSYLRLIASVEEASGRSCVGRRSESGRSMK